MLGLYRMVVFVTRAVTHCGQASPGFKVQSSQPHFFGLASNHGFTVTVKLDPKDAIIMVQTLLHTMQFNPEKTIKRNQNINLFLFYNRA